MCFCTGDVVFSWCHAQPDASAGPDPDALWVAMPNTTVSTLIINSTKQDHAGNYTCAPPHSTRDSIRLYVTAGIK